MMKSNKNMMKARLQMSSPRIKVHAVHIRQLDSLNRLVNIKKNKNGCSATHKIDNTAIYKDW